MTLQADDLALLRRIAAQEGQAFEALYTRYVPRLRRYLARLPGDPALIDDVCQDVMLVVWQQAARVPAAIPLFAWLCGIARHKAQKAWTRSAARATPPAVHQEGHPESLEDILMRQEYGGHLARALDTLPVYERMALLLFVQHGYSYTDIAAEMDTPVSTVRTRLWRACHRLRSHLAALDRSYLRYLPATICC